MDLAIEVARHSERIRELDEDVLAVRKTLLQQDEAIERIEKTLFRLLVQKKVVIGLIAAAIAVLGGGIAAGNWLMHAQLRNMMEEMHMAEMRAIK